MTEVTKEDREAAERWGTGPVYSMSLCAESYARHREASTEALRAVLRRIESAEYINSLQGTANFERLQQIARAALQESADG